MPDQPAPALPRYIRGKAPATLTEVRKDGGAMRITSPRGDRDRDRVMPLGGQLESYRRNPIVQWGHQYYEPWQTIGRTDDMTVSAEGIDVTFTLREPASDSDPQHIVRALWADGFITTASIGFQPLMAEPNDIGGYDFTAWELLEWSLVPIPANTDAARRALDAHPLAAKRFSPDEVVKAGRVLSAKNEARIRQIHEIAAALLAEIEGDASAAEVVERAAAIDAEALALDVAGLLLPEIKALLTPGTSPATPAPAAIDPLLSALRGLRAAAGIR